MESQLKIAYQTLVKMSTNCAHSITNTHHTQDLLCERRNLTSSRFAKNHYLSFTSQKLLMFHCKKDHAKLLQESLP